MMAQSNNDVRVVARGLLEHCLGVLEAYFIDGARVSDEDIDFAIKQLRAALATEKSELKAPSDQWEKPCGLYSSLSWKGLCRTCGFKYENHHVG